MCLPAGGATVAMRSQRPVLADAPAVYDADGDKWQRQRSEMDTRCSRLSRELPVSEQSRATTPSLICRPSSVLVSIHTNHSPFRQPSRTIYFCICVRSRLRARLPLCILLVHTQVQGFPTRSCANFNFRICTGTILRKEPKTQSKQTFSLNFHPTRTSLY
jgi:hypothetical protein